MGITLTSSLQLGLSSSQGGSIEFSPLSMTGIRAWFDASDAAANTYDGSGNASGAGDKTGNGYDAVQISEARNFEPVTVNGLTAWNSFPADAVDRVLRIPSASGFWNFSGQDITVVFVGSVNGNFKDVLATSANTALRIGTGFSNAMRGVSEGTATASGVSTPTMSTLGIYVYRLRADGISEYSRGGTDAFGSHAHVTGPMTPTSRDFILGAQRDNGNNGMEGTLCEMIVLDGYTPITEINQCGAYLADKWGLTFEAFGTLADLSGITGIPQTGVGNETYLTFSDSGTLVVDRPIIVDYRVTAGGGGGGEAGAGGGGGGAGGTAGVKRTLLAAGSYAWSVGHGGKGASNGGAGTSGENTVALGLTLIGGGRGGGNGVSPQDGGSGAGSRWNSGPAGRAGSLGTVGQGNDGGDGGDSTYRAAGGGGGATTAGGDASLAAEIAGDAGEGVADDITGVVVYYAVGAPGAGATNGSPATGGADIGQNAVNGTGNGGPGASNADAGDGGDGNFILRIAA